MKSIDTLCTIVVMVANFIVSPLVFAGAKDDPLLFMTSIDQFEKRTGNEDPTVLKAHAWAGYDLHKLWAKTEIERVKDKNEHVEVQLLYSRAITPFWNLELGARHDFKPQPTLNWAVIGLHGLTPYYFDVDATLFLGESGRSALRFEVEYELMLTQQWVLTPELELNFFGKTDPLTETGSGLANSQLGLRLVYEIRRELAPYFGINWEQKYGKTADFARIDGKRSHDIQFVFGLRAWF